MKRKDKNKAIDFLKKYQPGGFYTDDTLMQNPYDYVSDLQTAQQQQLVQYNQPKSQSTFIKPPVQNSPWDTAIPLIGPAINLGIGIKNIFDSFGERKRQKQYERAYRKDLEKRMEESRTSDYYYTPYGIPGTQYQKGGLYPDQNQDQFDFFIDFYNQKENQDKLQQQAFENYYGQKNQMMKQQWKQKQSSGIQGALSGAMGIAQTFLGKFQKGGFTEVQDSNYQKIMKREQYPSTDVNVEKAREFLKLANGDTSKIKDFYKMVAGADPEKPSISSLRRKDRFREHQEGGEYNPKTDLYSSEYDPNEFLGVVGNEINQTQIEDKELSTIEQWLFQDELDPYQEELNTNYFNPDSNNMNVVDKIMQMESGGNPEAVNPTTNATGLFQFVPKYWAGQIKSFMGLPQTFSQEQVMESFKKNPDVQKKFMNHVVNDIYMPEVEKLRPLARKYGFNDDQIIRLLHYRGINDATKRLQTGNFTVSESEVKTYKNPQILEYLNK